MVAPFYRATGGSTRRGGLKSISHPAAEASRMRLACLALAAFLALPGLAPAQLAADAPKAPKPPVYLWEVTSLTNRVFLYGTVHAGKASFYPLPERRAAGVRGLEGARRRGRHHRTRRRWRRARPRCSSSRRPRSRRRCRRPSTSASASGRALRPARGADRAVQALSGRLAPRLRGMGAAGLLAAVRRRPPPHRDRPRPEEELVELEGAEVQTELMDSLTEKEGLQALEGTVTALESGLTREQITGLVNAWQSGDPNLLLEVARAYNETVPGAKELEEKFIWSRHDAMANKIESYLLGPRPGVRGGRGAPPGRTARAGGDPEEARLHGEATMNTNREGGRILVEQLLIHGADIGLLRAGGELPAGAGRPARAPREGEARHLPPRVRRGQHGRGVRASSPAARASAS